MNPYDADQFEDVTFSVALTRELEQELTAHIGRDVAHWQEDLAFVYWRPSRGATRYTAVVHAVVLPRDGERLLQGNVAFTPQYIERVIAEKPSDSGIGLVHSHLGPGWQDMSPDDVIAERDRLAGIVASATGLPLLGLTWGTDDTWSARFWLRVGRHQYERRWAETVRAVGDRLQLSFHPTIRPEPPIPESQVATLSVWGQRAQNDIARVHVGVVGLGSVGSIVAEALSRTGFSRVSLIDHDQLEVRNLDRTLGAYEEDAAAGLPKVMSSKRLIDRSHTSPNFRADAEVVSLATPSGLAKALDCDVLLSCVDRPWPRHILIVLAYAHLIPVVDGGILARVDSKGRLLHVDWRIHTVGPGRACLYCLNALLRSDVALDRDGLLDDPDYIERLSPEERERYARRNVFAFSLSVAAHQVLQLVGLVTGNRRVGGIGPQSYHAFPGTMEVADGCRCDDECDVPDIMGTACQPF